MSFSFQCFTDSSVRRMDRASGWGIMRDFNGGSGWTAVEFVGDQWIVMSLGYVEAYGQGRAGYGGQEESRGALDGSEDAQGGGSGSGIAAKTRDEARDERIELCSREDYHCRMIRDYKSRIEELFYTIRQAVHYSHDTRIECCSICHSIVYHIRKIHDYLGKISRHTCELDAIQAELSERMDLN